jgi:hypothetical protein
MITCLLCKRPNACVQSQLCWVGWSWHHDHRQLYRLVTAAACWAKSQSAWNFSNSESGTFVLKLSDMVFDLLNFHVAYYDQIKDIKIRKIGGKYGEIRNRYKILVWEPETESLFAKRKCWLICINKAVINTFILRFWIALLAQNTDQGSAVVCTVMSLRFSQ